MKEFIFFFVSAFSTLSGVFTVRGYDDMGRRFVPVFSVFLSS